MAWGWITAVIGCVMVVFSLNRIIREIRKGGIPDLQDQSFSDTFYEALTRLDGLREDLDSINETFYESLERLEKRLEKLEKTAPSPRRRSAAVSQPLVLAAEDPVQQPAEAAAAKTGEQPETEEQQLQAEMRRLLESGKDLSTVARELNRGIGEVALVERLIRSKRQQ